MAETLKWPDLTGQDRFDKPWLNGMPRVIFVGDMADVFSRDVEFSYLKQEIVDVASVSKHIYMVLTKQARRMKDFTYWLARNYIPIPHNLWFGVSITSQATREQADWI